MCERGFIQVLAIDPTPRGLSFALLECCGLLVDWGSKRGVSDRSNRRCVADVEALIRLYRPNVLALEHCAAQGSRRRRRVRALIRALHNLAARKGIESRRIPPRLVRDVCAGSPLATKHEVALALAERFPELARAVPPRRRVWMSEDPRINVFDAVALAYVVVQDTKQSVAPEA